MDRPDVLASFGVEVVVQNLLSISVNVEIDASGRHNASEICAESSEEGTKAFMLIDGIEDLNRFTKVNVARSGKGEN